MSKANADNTQIRLIIADFPAELGHLRDLPMGNHADVIAVNKEIRS